MNHPWMQPKLQGTNNVRFLCRTRVPERFECFFLTYFFVDLQQAVSAIRDTESALGVSKPLTIMFMDYNW